MSCNDAIEPVRFDPEVPKVDSAVFVALITSWEAAAKLARAYLETGQLGLARQMLNVKMVLNVLETQQALPRMDAKIVAALQPLTDTERVAAKEQLLEYDTKLKAPDG